MATAVALLLFATAAAPARAQQPAPFEVDLRDGRTLAASAISAAANGGWRLTAPAGGAVEFALADLLALRGGAVVLAKVPAAHLAGGEVVRGPLVGGNRTGDSLELQSAVLGRTPLRVDRLDCLVFPGYAPSELELPDGVDEALFQKAALGFDRLAGSIHQFGEPGVRFQVEGKQEPRWYSPRELAGVRVRGAEPRKVASPFELLTRSGDRVGVELLGLGRKDQPRDRAVDSLRVKLEDGRELDVSLDAVGCLTNLGGGAVFASSLTPTAVREVAPDGDALLPWQRDQSVTGGPLVAAGRAHGRGLGVHSQSRLVFAVPDGAATFWARVAFDDAALELPVHGAVAVRVLRGEQVVFEQKQMTAGEPPRSTGLLPVQPGESLTLEVDFGAGRDLGDRIDWLSPVFLPARQ